jgi:hypothetical protein
MKRLSLEKIERPRAVDVSVTPSTRSFVESFYVWKKVKLSA